MLPCCLQGLARGLAVLQSTGLGGALLSLLWPPAHRAAAEPQLRASQELELCSMASQGRALGVALRAAEGAAGQRSQQGSALGSAPHSPAGLGAPTCTPLGAVTPRAGAVPSSSSLWVLQGLLGSRLEAPS